MTLKTKNMQIRVILSSAIVFAASIIMVLMKENLQDTDFITWCVLLSLVVFIYEIYNICKITGEIFTPSILFLAAFYVFQNGQLLLVALGIGFDMFYINTLNSLTCDVTLFSGISNMCAGLAGVVVAKITLKRNYHMHRVDKYNPKSVSNAAILGILVTGSTALPLLLIKFFGYALSGGYYAVRDFEGRLPAIIGLMEYLFVPFCFLYLVFSQNKYSRRGIIFLSGVWFLLTALCGDRTTGVSGLLMLAYLGYIMEHGKKNKHQGAVKLIVVGLLLIVFIKVAYAFRMQTGIVEAIFRLGHTFVGFLSELGFSCFPLFMMMNIVPDLESFQYGKQYLLSIIAGVVPSTLDLTGYITKWTSEWKIYDEWIYRYYSQYDFGVGFSLNAEAYINFGWFGIIAIFILCTIVILYLSENTTSRYGIYKVVVLTFIWFTLPRRSSYYIWNGIFWCVFIIGLYLRLMCTSRKRYVDKINNVRTNTGTEKC